MGFVLKIQAKNTFDEDLEYDENPYHVLERIHSRNTRKAIIRRLIELNYNFKNPFPFDSLATNYSVLTLVRSNLKKENSYYGFYEKKGKSGTTAEGLRYLLVSTSVNLSQYAFRKGYDLYINHEKTGACTVILNPAYKKEYTLRPLYIKLSRKEKEQWTLWRGESVLKADHTEIPKTELESYLKTFQFKK